MNICLFGKYFLPVIGGIEIHMRNLASYLIDRKYDVHVVCSNKRYRSSKKIDENSTVFDSICVHRYKSIPDMFSILRTVLKTCDIFHGHYYRNVDLALAVLFSRRIGLKTPFVLTPHCIYPAHGIFSGLIKRTFDITGGKILLKADRIICLTPNDKEDMLRLGGREDRITIIPNSIPFRNFEKLPGRNDFKKMFRVEDNTVLSYVGRTDWNKRLEKIVESLPKLPKDVCFVVAGEAAEDYKKYLLDLGKKLGVKERLLFTGYLSDESLLKLYRDTDVFVLPSIYEGLPTCILEAMACECVVLASASGGTKYLIEHGVNGYFLNNGISWGDAISHILKNRSEFQLIGERARSTIKQKYSWEQNVEKIIKLYDDLLKR